MAVQFGETYFAVIDSNGRIITGVASRNNGIYESQKSVNQFLKYLEKNDRQYGPYEVVKVKIVRDD